MKTKIELLVKQTSPLGTDIFSLHVSNTEMFMPPRKTETIIYQGDSYNIIDVIHNYDKNKIEIILIPMDE